MIWIGLESKIFKGFEDSTLGFTFVIIWKNWSFSSTSWYNISIHLVYSLKNDPNLDKNFKLRTWSIQLFFEKQFFESMVYWETTPGIQKK